MIRCEPVKGNHCGVVRAKGGVCSLQGGSVTLLGGLSTCGVAVSRALQSATVVSSTVSYFLRPPLPFLSNILCNFRVFNQVLFFIAQTLKMESSKVM